MDGVSCLACPLCVCFSRCGGGGGGGSGKWGGGMRVMKNFRLSVAGDSEFSLFRVVCRGVW